MRVHHKAPRETAKNSASKPKKITLGNSLTRLNVYVYKLVKKHFV